MLNTCRVPELAIMKGVLWCKIYMERSFVVQRCVRAELAIMKGVLWCKRLSDLAIMKGVRVSGQIYL